MPPHNQRHEVGSMPTLTATQYPHLSPLQSIVAATACRMLLPCRCLRAAATAAFATSAAAAAAVQILSSIKSGIQGGRP